ncbi:MAG: hypothetical protein KBG28_28310 [Kofleriaceae bacterium]|nr:hypothetical protein [Kofleriaceae bacterium]MBP9207902.1 hypothetical protein [Kofleriaceae bacterium]
MNACRPYLAPAPRSVRRATLGLLVVLAVGLASATGCAHVSTTRVQAENVAVAPGYRPVAAIQANATSLYVLFVGIPGGIDLDRVINRMLIVTAKTMGADKVIDLDFDVTPSGGVWSLRKLLGWRSARASGLAVKVDVADPGAEAGPEPAAAPGATAPGGAPAPAP